MPTIQGSASIAANASDNNLLDTNSEDLRTMPLDAIGICTVYLTSSAIGLLAGVSVSGRIEMYQSTFSLLNRAPIDPDDKLLEGVVAQPSEILQLSVRNSTGGALTIFYRIDITYTPIL